MIDEMGEPSERAIEVARIEARLLIDDGAEAVVLTGSHARGDAHAESDLDVRGVGEESPKNLKRHEEFLVSTSVMTPDAVEQTFVDPEEIGQFVPGWRDAVILIDPKKLAAGFQARAVAWKWDQLESSDSWLADEITSQAEEIHTLIGNIDQGQTTGAAAIRSQLVQGLAKLLSVHRQILYGSENDLWDLVADAMGPRYADLQATALGLRGAALDESSRATFGLFVIAVDELWALLDDRQRGVVGHARELSAARRASPEPTDS